MIRVCEAGHPPARVVSGQRCRECDRLREQGRPSSAERGYGAPHRRARASLVAHLPARCLYCQAWVDDAGDMDAAHIRAGDPSSGWAAAHRVCNQREMQSRKAQMRLIA